MANYNFLVCFKPQIQSSLAKKLKLNIHLTESPKRVHIYKQCLLILYLLEEHECLILTYYCVPKLKYSTHAKK